MHNAEVDYFYSNTNTYFDCCVLNVIAIQMFCTAMQHSLSDALLAFHEKMISYHIISGVPILYLKSFNLIRIIFREKNII